MQPGGRIVDLKHVLERELQYGSFGALYLILLLKIFEIFDHGEGVPFLKGGHLPPPPIFLTNWPIFSIHIFLERSEPWIQVLSKRKKMAFRNIFKMKKSVQACTTPL